MKIKTIIVFYFAFLSINCFSQADSFRIKGTVTNDYDGYIYLSYGEKTDSCLIKDKNFFFDGNIDFPVESRLHIKNGISTGNFYLENSTMEIEISIDEPITVTKSISGNKTAKIKSNLREFIGKYKSDSKFSSKLYNKLDSIFTENPMNQFCGNVLSDIAMDPILTYEQIYSLYSKLDKTAQKKETKESINASLDKLKNIKVGSQFKHFELPVKKGNLINTSELKYKILLVEFWASWCRPCRQDNPKLLEIYKTYNDSSFEIFGVSLDTDKEAWMQAIEKDSLIWVNTIAQEGWNNQVLKSLGIQYIPSNYLIDKNGNILAINISPDDLEKKLSELLKK